MKGAEAHRRQMAYAFWSVLNGTAPPVPHQGSSAGERLLKLEDAHACFKGVNRPVADDDHGSRMVAYVLKPEFFYKYEFLSPIVFTTREPVPIDLVFVAYVHLDKPGVCSDAIGTLTHWQFVDADPRDGFLPVDFDSRYTTRLW